MKRAQLKRLSSRREARRTRTLNNVKVNVDRPRLLIHRSNKHLYAQVLHPTNANVLAAASTVEKSIGEALKSTSNIEAAAAVGAAIGKRALENGVTQVVFDRKNYRYHGRVKAMADAAREAGLSF